MRLQQEQKVSDTVAAKTGTQKEEITDTLAHSHKETICQHRSISITIDAWFSYAYD